MIIGAGAVGLEFAYVYAMYGAKVTVVEMAAQALPGADPEIAQVVEREFRRKKIEIRTGTRFEELKVEANGVRVIVRKGDASEALEADQVLVAIGRRALSADLGLEAAGVAIDAKGFVPVDAAFATNVPSVRGDRRSRRCAAARTQGQRRGRRGRRSCWPASRAGRSITARSRPASTASRRSRGSGTPRPRRRRSSARCASAASRSPHRARRWRPRHTAGFAKIIAEPRFGEIVGAHIVGHGATELIAEMSLAMTLEATTAEIAATCHAHPTLSEAILESALAAEGRSINF